MPTPGVDSKSAVDAAVNGGPSSPTAEVPPATIVPAAQRVVPLSWQTELLAAAAARQKRATSQPPAGAANGGSTAAGSLRTQHAPSAAAAALTAAAGGRVVVSSALLAAISPRLRRTALPRSPGGTPLKGGAAVSAATSAAETAENVPPPAGAPVAKRGRLGHAT